MNLRTILKSDISIYIIKTVLFYVCSFIVISILNKQSPAGPCVPGLGMFAFLLLLPVSVILFLINLYKGAEVSKLYWASALVHLLVWVIIALM